jgi:hypothetical protein
MHKPSFLICERFGGGGPDGISTQKGSSPMQHGDKSVLFLFKTYAEHILAKCKTVLLIGFPLFRKFFLDSDLFWRLSATIIPFFAL